MQWSYWEIDRGWNTAELIVVGGGLVGLTSAIEWKRANPSKKVMVLERGFLPIGASTRNAGFACFGSMTELLDDLKSIGDEGLVSLVERRWNGLSSLRELHGDASLGFRPCGGYELFPVGSEEAFRHVMEKLEDMNARLASVFGQDVFSLVDEPGVLKQYSAIIGAVSNPLEGSIHPGLMMESLLCKAKSLGVELMFGAELSSMVRKASSWQLKTKAGRDFGAANVLLCNNGWARRFLDLPLRTVRNQVLVTERLDRPLAGHVYHIDRGYYYFRTVDQGRRILLGGGRHRMGEEEETDDLAVTARLKEHLTEFLHRHIHPTAKVEYHWSGILGVGDERSPLVQNVGDGLYIAVRLGGMGIAIGTDIGMEAARMISSN